MGVYFYNDRGLYYMENVPSSTGKSYKPLFYSFIFFFGLETIYYFLYMSSFEVVFTHTVIFHKSAHLTVTVTTTVACWC